MNILSIHTHYQQRGGEDSVFQTEARMLEAAGHRVTTYTLHNDVASTMNPVALGLTTHWNRSAYRSVRDLVRRLRPDAVHFHNTFPVMSPAVLHAARSAGVPVIQTLHNYRLLCPSGTLFRENQVCEDCTATTVPWPAVRHACYRNSRLASATTASMLAFHRLLGTWSRCVDAFIALSEFARRRFIEAGLPADRIHVKPNALFPDPGSGPGSALPPDASEAFGLFVGRLSPEKGVSTLCAALRNLAAEGITPQFRFVGRGPLQSEVEQTARAVPGVSCLGELDQDDVLDLIGRARFLVVPSLWYEGFPRVVVEALARGTPVLTSKLGSLAELITPNQTGLHVSPGDVTDLQRQMTWLTEHPAATRTMGQMARKDYELRFGAAANLQSLLRIYRAAGAQPTHA